jgi:cytochrome c-type biogenesis protein
MEFSYPTVLVVPLGLGLLGFVEPCTVGGHLVFLRAMAERPRSARLVSMLAFTLVRTLVMGSFGALVVLVGRLLIEVQTALWIVFGSIYVLIGLAFAMGPAGAVKRRIDFAPIAWKATTSPLALGVAFGLVIPACAAPILFGLIGLAATSGAVTLGFATMAVFALALSFPLAVLAASPVASSLAAKLAGGTKMTRWVLAVVFVVLGIWSLWFGAFVDPADWTSL